MLRSRQNLSGISFGVATIQRNKLWQQQNNNKLSKEKSKNEDNSESNDLCKKNTLDYLKNSSMHGLHYVGDQQLTLFERMFWILSFILAVIAATLLITQLFIKFRQSPIIVALSPTTVQLTDIPFPAITICNINNMRKSRALKVLERAKNKSDKVAQMEKEMMNLICESYSDGETEGEEAITGESLVKFYEEVSQPCKDMIQFCIWRGRVRNCDKYFVSVPTDEGLCCRFNSVKWEFILSDAMNFTKNGNMESVDWSPEKGYPPETPPNILPFRPLGAGSSIGLTVIIDSEKHEYYCSNEISTGFKVLLHSPIETVKVSSFATLVPPSFETRYVINPDIRKSQMNVLEIDLDKRMCYFEKERILTYYRTYTQRNCNSECETNLTRETCGCVPFYMPRTDLLPVCDGGDYHCILNISRELELNSSIIISCSCLPGCFEIGYNGYQTAGPISSMINVSDTYPLNGVNQTYFVENMAIVHFYFLYKQFTSVERSVLYGFTEFLSNTGGLLGLFLGFSFLSVVEIVYYLTLRMFCAIRQNRKHQADAICRLQQQARFTTVRRPFQYIH